MYDFHKDKERYFEMQRVVTQSHIIPFLKHSGVKVSNICVLEIGCAEAGVLKAFLDMNNKCLGIELSEERVKLAKKFLEEEIQEKRVTIINKNIYEINPDRELDTKFDLIILKDVIEHIPDQEKFIGFLKLFLKDDGIVFFGFPPWYMPFGGHQQICKSKFLRIMPWIHLLPGFIYKFLLTVFDESKPTINELLEIKSTGITIERIKRICKKEGYSIIGEKYWFINPIYKYKFGLKPRAYDNLLSSIPYIRNIYTTAHYLLIKP